MRVNVHRLISAEDDDEYIRRPMASLTTSTAPITLSNITMISTSDLPNNQKKEKSDKSKKQSLPDVHDFPALPSTKTKTQNINSGREDFRHSYLNLNSFYFSCIF